MAKFHHESRWKDSQGVCNYVGNSFETVLTIVLLQLKTEGQLPDEIKKATDLKGRIKQLGIEDQLKFYAENEKNIRSLLTNIR